MWGLPSGTLHGINTARPRRLRVWRPPRCSGFPRLWRRCRLPFCSGVVSVVSWFAALARGGLGPDGGAAPVAAAFPVCFRGGYLGWIASSLEAVLFFFILSHWIGLLPSPPRFFPASQTSSGLRDSYVACPSMGGTMGFHGIAFVLAQLAPGEVLQRICLALGGARRAAGDVPAVCTAPLGTL